MGKAACLRRYRQRLPREGTVRSPSRLFILILLAVSLSALWPARAEAQRATRRVVRRPVVRSAVFIRSGFYYPYGGFYYPYGGFYPWSGYYPWGFYPYGFYRYDDSASVRIQATPRDAEVFVDGYYAGVVDDYDGMFQRLRLAPGPHDIVLYHERFRSVRESLYLSPHAGYRLRHTMTPLGSGEAPEARPSAPDRAESPRDPRSGAYPPGVYPPGTLPMPGSETGPRRERPDPDRADQPVARFGTLSIRVQPADAEVIVDGERWRGPEATDRLTLQLADGPHRVEIRKEGYETFSTEVRIRAGETSTLNVSLPPLRMASVLSSSGKKLQTRVVQAK
jgi:hypothetical protein